MTYREKASFLAESDYNGIMLNTGTSHATDIISTFFEYSQKSLYIICEELNEVVYSNSKTLAFVRDFLENNGELNILVQTLNNDQILKTAFVKNLGDVVKSSKVKIYSSRDNDIERQEENFQVGDSKMYRDEIDLKSHKALVNFNDTNKSNKFIKKFNKLIKTAAPITF